MSFPVKDKKVTVVGLGKSGRAAARLLDREGAVVTVTDRRPAGELGESMAALEGLPIRYRVGGHPAEAFRGADLIVISPGVPVEAISHVGAARKRGVPVIGEIELGYRFANAPLVGVTGTNGKSTTTSLAGEILKAAGRKVFVGGNLGRPLSEAVTDPETGGEWDWMVVEVSSFQLETIRDFHPRVGALLNLAENHLDRYGRMKDYLDAKMRLFENQTDGDWAIINADDPVVLKATQSLRARRILIGRNERAEEGVYLRGDSIISSVERRGPSHRGREAILKRQEIPLRGHHNLENVLAAAAIGLACDCPPETIRQAVQTFAGLPHRLEPVRVRDDVLYINDSKATTAAALARALESFEEPIILIAGGRDAGSRFGVLRDLIKRRVKTAILIGEARDALREAWEGATALAEAESLEDAVRLSARMARPGDVVLLAPACASFDMFRDFEDRGRRFKEAVLRLD